MKKIIVFSSVVLFIYFFILFGIHQRINIYDEGLMAYSATRVARGDVPYADFWAYYGPAQYYVVALIFKCFGASLTALRTCNQLTGCLLLAMMYLVVRKLSNDMMALGALLASTIVLVASYTLTVIFISHLSALFFSLLGCFFLLNFLSERRTIWIILSGLSVAVTTLFRHEMGLYTFLSHLIVILAFFFFDPSECGRPISQRVFRSFKTLLYYFLSIAALLLPAGIYFFYHAGPRELVYDLIIFPTKVYPRMRSLPYLSPLLFLLPILCNDFSFGRCLHMLFLEVPYYFPIFISAMVFLLLFNQFRLRIYNRMHIIKWRGLLFALLGLFFFTYASIRSDYTHLLPILFISVIQFFFLAYEYRRNRAIASVFLIAYLLFCYAIVSTRGWGTLKDALLRYRQTAFFDVPRARGIPIDRSEIDYRNAIRYIHTNTLDKEKIFVGNIRHDRIVTNDVMFYFLSERDSATKYYDLHPGVATEAAIQEKIIRDIEEQGVRYVVVCGWDFSEPNESSKSSGVFLLDDFIKDRFAPVRSFGNYSILKRNP